jgi:signal transduction histidine kinase
VVDDDDLVVVVADNGTGIPSSAPHGVGMVSMRERTDELGGTFRVLERDGGGTRLVVRLPIAGARP